MGEEAAQTATLPAGAVTTGVADQRIRQFLEENASATILHKTIRQYLSKAKFLSSQELDETTLEVLSEVVAAALVSSERYDPTRSPMAWVLGIASNIVKQKRDRHFRLAKREKPISHIGLDPDDELISPGDFFDRLAALDPHVFEAIAVDDPEPELARRQPLLAAFARLPATDQNVLKLAFLHEMDGEALARELDITPGHARVTKHRALERLRQAYRKEGDER